MMEYPLQLAGNEKPKPYSVFLYSIPVASLVVGKAVAADGAHPAHNPGNETKASDRNLKYPWLRIFPLLLRFAPQ